MAKNKWVKPDSQFASGSSGRVTRNMRTPEPPRLTPAQKRQANPKCRADKSVLRDKTTKRR